MNLNAIKILIAFIILLCLHAIIITTMNVKQAKQIQKLEAIVLNVQNNP
jgi:hypothetical protein